MEKSDEYYINLFSYVEKTIGESSDNVDIVSLVNWMGYAKFPDFPEEEWSVYLSKKDFGFSLLFQDADILPTQWARGRLPGTPIFTGCFLYSDGMEGFAGFSGNLPHGISWLDNPDAIRAKFKEIAKPFHNKETGLLTSHMLGFEKIRITAKYNNDHSSLCLVYVGLN